MLRGIEELDFVGNIEGRDVFSGEVDVIVHDGFVGNILLKTVEGAVESIRAVLRQEIERSVVSRAAAGALQPAFDRSEKPVDATG